MANANDNVRNEIISDVELYWAKLGKPVEPFGTLQWELQIRFPKKRVSEMEAYGTPKEVKGEKGVYSLNLKKKALLADGTSAKPIEVVGTKKDQVIDPRTLGNGSRGNVKVMLKDYQIKGPNGKVTKEGTSVMLTKVQVTDLVKYEPKSGNDFDFDEEDDTPAATKKAPAKRTRAQEEDDQIPF